MKRVLMGAGGVAVVAAVAAAWLLGFFTPEPDEVSLTETLATNAVERAHADAAAAASTAVAELEPTTVPTVGTASEAATVSPSPTPQPTTAPAADAGPLDGEWQLRESDATFAGYRANGATGEAVGRTSAVEGSLVASGNQVVAVDISVDMTQVTSDSRVRDDHLGSEGLEWRRYPVATFELDEAITLPEEVATDQQFDFSAAGTLTVREVPVAVTVELEAVQVDDDLIVVGSAPVSLDEFGAGIGGVDDDAVMEFSLVFAR